MNPNSRIEMIYTYKFIINRTFLKKSLPFNESKL